MTYVYVPLWDSGFIKFEQEYNFVPSIGEQTFTEMLFLQFFNINIYVKIDEKYQINIWMYDYSQIQGTR